VIADRGDVRASEILRAEGVDAFRALPHLQSDHIRPAARAPVEMIGVHPLRDGRRALGVGLAFSHAEAETLIALVESAAAHGARAVRPAPSRVLLLVGITEHNVTAVTRAAEQLGFVTRADDARRRIVACPGAPACASGFIAARAIASEVSKSVAARRPGTIHISGCAKGCAHPQPAALTIVGSERGCGIVERGTARATPQQYVDPRQLAAHLAHRVSETAHG
jgi:precorrin-3B synthase